MSAGTSATPLGPVAEARLLPPLLLARRTRIARQWPACAGHVLSALRVTARACGAEPPLSCEPIRHARGGFFAVLVETPSGPRFAKAVPAGGREARFWAAWKRGEVRDGGAHYRLLPPESMATGRLVAVLTFPALTGLEMTRAGRTRGFRQNALDAARAMAEFNADHPAPDFPDARGCGPVPVPSRRRVAETFGLDPARAAAIVAELRAIEADWGRIGAAVQAGDRCLSHMDLGLGNFAFGDPPPILLDFGHAGAAPFGADLHTMLLRTGRSGPDTDALVAAYVAVYEAKGMAVDPAAVRLSAEAHCAARYRDLRFASARKAETFEAALALSRTLIAAARG